MASSHQENVIRWYVLQLLDSVEHLSIEAFCVVYYVLLYFSPLFDHGSYQGCQIGILNAKFHNFGIFWSSLEFKFGRFLNLAIFWYFSDYGFTKCQLLSYTEFLNNIHLNKYACMFYQRLLKALHYCDFNLLVNVTALYGHSRGENIIAPQLH